jgi:hypothetical protein
MSATIYMCAEGLNSNCESEADEKKNINLYLPAGSWESNFLIFLY